MLKRNLMIASGVAMALALSACSDNAAEDTTGTDMMTTEDGTTTEQDDAMMGVDGTMAGEAAAGSMSSGAAGANASGSDSMSSGATGTNVPGSGAPEDVVGDQPSGGSNVPTPE